jgi:hypothetical protein
MPLLTYIFGQNTDQPLKKLVAVIGQREQGESLESGVTVVNFGPAKAPSARRLCRLRNAVWSPDHGNTGVPEKSIQVGLSGWKAHSGQPAVERSLRLPMREPQSFFYGIISGPSWSLSRVCGG